MPISIRHAALLLNFFLATLATAVTFLFGLFKLINLLDIRFYLLYSPMTVNIVIFSPTVDLSIWVVSLLVAVLEMLLVNALRDVSVPRWTILPFLLLVASLAVFQVNGSIAYFLAVPAGLAIAGLSTYYGNGYLLAGRKEAAALTLSSVTGLLILFELASASSWISNIFDYEVPFGSSSRWIFPTIDLQMFNVLYPLTSWLFLLFLYSWIWIPAVKHALSRVTSSKRMGTITEKISPSGIQDAGSTVKLNSKRVTLCLLLSLAAAAFIAYYPYVHLPNSALIGSDSMDYVNWLSSVAQKGLQTAFNTDRPFPILLMYAVQIATGSSPETVVRIMPTILAICLSLAIYWFVKVGTKNELAALMSSLFSSFSFQITVGLFGYFLANWLAIIESLVLMIFLLNSFEKQSWKYLAASAVMGFSVLLTHPYTWDVLMAILIIYFAWALIGKRSRREREILLLILLLASNFLFYTVYALAPFGKGISSSAGGGIYEVGSGISVSNLLNLQRNVAMIVQSYVGGLLGNPLLVLLAIVGVFSMFDFAKRFNKIMILWIAVPALALLAVSPDPYYYRFLYLIPIQIQAAVGVVWIMTRLEVVKSWFKTNRNFRIFKILIVVLIVFFLFNYALRSVDEALVHVL
ncbi:MAG: hypothetical protein ABSB89_02160 [Candidatus Bathyarchaeia archaeon]|jgi:hypothetical protein